jgi:hypothetical protein
MIEKADCVLRKIQSTLVVLLAAGTLHAQDTGQGGQTTGNNPSTAGHILEYANYKRALEPFWSTTPVYVGMGIIRSLFLGALDVQIL